MDNKLLRDRLNKAGLSLPWTFNFNDKIRLAETKDEKELKDTWNHISDSIRKVARANLAINHSNFS